MQVSKVLGYRNAGYVSDTELGRFVTHPDKLAKWAEALGMTQEEMDSRLADAKLEDMGLTDPGFTLMFKEVPNMTAEEKESIISSYKNSNAGQRTQDILKGEQERPVNEIGLAEDQLKVLDGKHENVQELLELAIKLAGNCYKLI